MRSDNNGSEYLYVDKYYLATFTIPGDPEPNVTVRVTGRIVQVQREDTGIAAIAPVAAAKESAKRLQPHHRI